MFQVLTLNSTLDFIRKIEIKLYAICDKNLSCLYNKLCFRLILFMVNLCVLFKLLPPHGRSEWQQLTCPHRCHDSLFINVGRRIFCFLFNIGIVIQNGTPIKPDLYIHEAEFGAGAALMVVRNGDCLLFESILINVPPKYPIWKCPNHSVGKDDKREQITACYCLTLITFDVYSGKKLS